MKNFKKFHFIGQKDNENIILVVRRHWFDIFAQLFLVFFMVVLLIAGHVYAPLLFPFFKTAPMDSLFLFLESLFAMMIWIVFFLIWIDYYFDVWFITDRRIVDVSQKGLFNRHVSELEHENIQDVTTEVVGVIPTFLNYGDVFVQTAAEKERFVFRKVPNPYGIKDIIMHLHKEQEKKETDELGEMIEKKIHG